MTQREKDEISDAKKWESAREYQKFAERHGFQPDTIRSIPDLVGLSEEDKKIFLANVKEKRK